MAFINRMAILVAILPYSELFLIVFVTMITFDDFFLPDVLLFYHMIESS